MRVFRPFADAVRRCTEIFEKAAQWMSKHPFWRPSHITSSVRQAWVRHLSAQAPRFYYVRRLYRPLGYECLESRTLLAGTVLTFVPGAYTVNGVDVWTADPSKHNWLNGNTQTGWGVGDIAKFNTSTSGTAQVTVSDTYSPVSIEEIQFAAGSWGISGDAISLYQPTSGNPIIEDYQPGNPASYTVASDTISSQIVPGTASVVQMTGTGTVALTYPGTNNNPPSEVDLDGGALQLTPGAIGSASIVVNPGSNNTVALTFQGGIGTATFNNPIALESGILRTDTLGNNITLSGEISGPTTAPFGSLVSSDTQGNGTLTLTNSSNSGYDWSTTVVSGTLELGASSVLGTGLLTVGGGVLDLGSTTYTPSSTLFSFYGGGIADGTLDLTSCDLTADFSNPGAADTGDIAFVSATIEGTIEGTYGVDVTGGGTLLLLAPDNSYGGDTSVDSGNILVYRWDGLSGNYSIPTSSTIAGSGSVESESNYFGANAVFWNAPQGGTWDAGDASNTVWLAPAGNGSSYVVPGNYGVVAAYWTNASIASDLSSAVFETPVNGLIVVQGTVAVGTSMTFIVGSDSFKYSYLYGGEIDLDPSATTNVDILDPNTTQFFNVQLDGGASNYGLDMADPGNLFLGEYDGYLGTTTLCAGAAINFVQGGLSGGQVIVAAGTGTASLVFDNPGYVGYPTLNNAIDIASGTLRIDTSNQDATIDGTISGDGNLEVEDSVGGGALTLSGTNALFSGVTTVPTPGITLTLGNEYALEDSTFDTTGPGTLSFGTLTTATFGGLQGSGDLTLENSSLAAVALTVGGNDSSTTMTGTIDGSGSLDKVGSGSLTLTGDDGFTGTLIVSQGTVAASYLGDNSNGTGTITLGSADTSGTLQYLRPASASTTRGLDVLAGGGEFDDLGGTFTFESTTGSSINASGNLTFGGTGNLKIGTPNSPTYQEIYVQGGNLTFAGSNVTINNEIYVSSSNTLVMDLIYETNDLDLDGGGTDNVTQILANQGVFTVDNFTPFFTDPILTFGSGSTAVFQLNGNNVTLAGLYSNETDPGTPIVEDASDAEGASVLTVAGGGASAFAGTIEDWHSGSPLTLIVAGSLTLSGANSYSAGTTVTSGTLIVTAANSLPTGTALTVGAGGVFIFDPTLAGTPADGGDGPDPSDPVDGAPTPGGTGGTPAPVDPGPALASITCVGPSVVDANSVAFNVAFTTPVTGLAPADFAVDGSGTVTSVSGSLCDYTVNVSVAPGSSGRLGLNVVDGSTITDCYGTPLDDNATIPVDEQFTVTRDLYCTAGSCMWGTAYADFHLGSEDGPLQAWTAGSDAIFEGAPGTVTIPNPVQAASITFLSSGWVIAGDAITLAPSPPASLPSTGEVSVIDVAVGAATIDCEIVGTFAKTDNGVLVLNGGLVGCTSLTVTAGALDLGGTMASVSNVTLFGGSLADGSLNVADSVDVYNGSVSADVSGAAALNKLGPDTVFLAGNDSYTGGTRALGGTLIAAADTLPSPAIGCGTVVVQPTLFWPAGASGDWATGPWQLADGTPTVGWIEGSSVVIGAGANISLSGVVNVSNVTFERDATISGGGTLSLSGTTIDVLSGTATVDVMLAGGGFSQTGPGTLVLDGAATVPGTLIVDQGTLDLLAPQVNPPVVVGGRAIGPGAVFSGNDSLYAIDPAMFNLVQSLFVDQTIDRDDMIEILQSAVVDDAVTPAALAALEAITSPQGETALNAPGYVGVLASDVVNGNPANANYRGQPLGNLTDQGSAQAMATTLEDLVGKWFNGTDLPAIDPSAAAAGATYSVVAGSLFGSAQAPSSADMGQGALGDCYFVAAVGAIADSDPTAIESMFTANGVENGTAASYTVRFYYYDPARGYVPDYVTVNTALPVFPNGSLVYAHPGPDGSLWLPLLEKAYSQWDETRNEGRSGENSYAALTNGFMEQVDAQVLGTAATVSFPATSDLTAKQTLIAALETGAAVTVGCFSNNSQLQLVGGHSYDVAGYDAASDTFLLKNPWGYCEPSPLTWGQLCQYCDWLVVAEASSPAATSSLTVGSQAVGASAVEVRASALPADWGRQLMPDAAVVVDVASQGQGDPATSDSLRKAHVRTIDLVLAEYGR